MGPEIREEILDNFYKIQKIYHGFARLVHNYKYKKANLIIETDLIMNPIKENSRCIFCLYQQWQKTNREKTNHQIKNQNLILQI
jgi:hypothetical protein